MKAYHNKYVKSKIQCKSCNCITQISYMYVCYGQQIAYYF